MSFNIKHKGPRAEVLAAVSADTTLPEGVKSFVNAGIGAIKGDGEVEVSAYGHLHTGVEGDHDESTATISVKPVAAAAATE